MVLDERTTTAPQQVFKMLDHNVSRNSQQL
jgi:hypothetical protein